jgi:iron complex outermembrane receptor protein
VFFPGGATQAQIATLTAHVPIGGALPGTVYYIYQFQQANLLTLGIQGLDINAHYQFETDNYGTFTVGNAVTEFLKYNESNAVGTPFYSVLNTDGANQTFPSVQMQMRPNFGWAFGNFMATLYINYTGSYRNWGSNTVAPLVYGSNGEPVAGGDKVNSFTTVDLHLAYDFNSGIFGDSQVYVEGQNIANASPPFYNAATGYDVREANPFGRVLSIGLKAKW